MNDFEDVGSAPTYASNFDEREAVEIRAIPDRGLHVTAATVSLLAANSNEEALGKYQELIGRDPAYIPKAIETQAQSSRDLPPEAYTSALVGILGDAKLSEQQKSVAVDTVRQGGLGNKQPYSRSLAEKSIVENSAIGENENAVLDALVKNFNEANDFWEEERRLESLLAAKADGSLDSITDAIGMFIPGEGGITGAKIAKRTSGDNSLLQGLVLPGSFRKELSERIKNASYEEKLKLGQDLYAAVSQSSGLLLGENSIRAHQWFNEVMRGDIGTPGAYLDNVVNVLDLVGLGSFARSAIRGKQLVKATDGPLPSADEVLDIPRAVAEPSPSARAPSVIQQEDLASVGQPQIATRAQEVSELEARKDELLGLLTGKLDKGQVSNLLTEKEAIEAKRRAAKLTTRELSQPGVASKALARRQDLDAQIERISSQLEANARAAKADQEITKIESDIASLKKDTSVQDASQTVIAEAISRIGRNSVRGMSNPTSPAHIFEMTNTLRSQAAHAQVYFDQSGELSKALSGNTRGDTLMRAVSPQVGAKDGLVAKVVDNKESLIKDVLSRSVGLEVKNSLRGVHFTDKEIESARAAIKFNIYENNGVLKINDAMTTIGGSGTRVDISAVYTTGNGGWADPVDAITQARQSLRNVGADAEDFELLKVEGSNYVPVKLEDVAGLEGEYAIRLKMDYDITSSDVVSWEALDVKRNWFDRFAKSGQNKQGSFNRHITTAVSMFDRAITGGVGVSDAARSKFTAQLTEMFSENFSKGFRKLDKDRQIAIEEYIKRANIEELAFDPVALRTEFTAAEVDILKGWRDSWDTMWVLENRDLARSLDQEGYQLFDHPNARVFVKHRAKNFSNNKVYDPASDSVVKLNEDEIRQIYAKHEANKGGIYEMRHSMTVEGQTVNHIIVRNQGSEIARKFKDTDKVLDYRDGYYQVVYKNPQFITRKGEDGIFRPVAVTGDIKDAQRILEALQKENPGVEFGRRGDVRKGTPSSVLERLDVQHAQGRSSQRHRSQLLENSTGLKQMGDLTYLESPVDSAARAARSLGGRVAMRDTLEAMKTRYINQYEDLIKVDPEKGVKGFPTSRDMLHDGDQGNSARLADARSTYEYIRQIESGYVNVMDETIQNFFGYLADVAGEKIGPKWPEKFMRATSNGKFSSLVKGSTHTAVIITNPLRQLLMNYFQVSRMMAYSPESVLSGRAQVLAHKALAKEVGMDVGKADANFLEFYKWYSESGVKQGIARDNLVRDTILAQSDRGGTMTALQDATLGNVRRYGYEYAENMNYIMHASIIWDRAKIRGVDVSDARVRDNMIVDLQAVTGNMNASDDMPYNGNWMGLLMTYFQVPHKFTLAALNRQLNREDRARLLVGDVLAFGLPVALVDKMLDRELIPEQEWMKDLLKEGLLSLALNRVLAPTLTGEVGRTSFESLNPFGMGSWGELYWQAATDKGGFSVIEGAPAWRVLGISENSKIGQALITTYKFFKGVADDSTPENIVKWTTALNSWAEFSSGWTNAQKAQLAWTTGKLVDKYNRPIDDNVTRLEAAWLLFGFPTKDSMHTYETIKINSEKDIEEEAVTRAKTMMRLINRISPADPNSFAATEMYMRAMNDNTPWKDKAIHQKVMKRMFEEMQKPQHVKQMDKLLREMGYFDMDEFPSKSQQFSQLTPEQKEIAQAKWESIVRFTKEYEAQYGR